MFYWIGTPLGQGNENCLLIHFKICKYTCEQLWRRDVNSMLDCVALHFFSPTKTTCMCLVASSAVNTQPANTCVEVSKGLTNSFCWVSDLMIKRWGQHSEGDWGWSQFNCMFALSAGPCSSLVLPMFLFSICCPQWLNLSRRELRGFVDV